MSQWLFDNTAASKACVFCFSKSLHCMQLKDIQAEVLQQWLFEEQQLLNLHLLQKWVQFVLQETPHSLALLHVTNWICDNLFVETRRFPIY